MHSINTWQHRASHTLIVTPVIGVSLASTHMLAYVYSLAFISSSYIPNGPLPPFDAPSAILYTAHGSTAPPRIPLCRVWQDFQAKVRLGRSLSRITQAPELRSVRLRSQRYHRIGRGELVCKPLAPTGSFTLRRQHQKEDCTRNIRCAAPYGARIALDDLAKHRRDSPNHPTCDQCNLGFGDTAEYIQVKCPSVEWV